MPTVNAGRTNPEAGKAAAGHGRCCLIVNAPIQRNRRDEDAAIKQGQVPDDWDAAKRVQKDVDARWTKKHGKSLRSPVTP